MKGKIHATGVTPQKPGPTITKNDPAKFSGEGRGGSVKSNGVVAEAEGPTFTVNKTHIPTVNPKTTPKATKVLSVGKGESPHAGAYAKNASDVGSSGGQPHSCLKASYGK